MAVKEQFEKLSWNLWKASWLHLEHGPGEKGVRRSVPGKAWSFRLYI